MNRYRWLASMGVAVAASCGGTGARQGFIGADGDGAPGGQQGDGGAPTITDASSGADSPVFVGGDEGGSAADAGTGASSCPASAEMIYVTGFPAELWSFWPPTFTFTKIGNLSCTSTPTHMTVDRTGTAWVVGDGNVYQASTKTAFCSLAAKWLQQTTFPDFAVSFVGVNNNDTSLYLLGGNNDSELAVFDIASGSFKVVGTSAVSGAGGDMTSIGDGKLWYLELTDPRPLYQIDPLTAKVLKTQIVKIPVTGSQALAYFGARFYVFDGNNVYDYDPTTGAFQLLGNAPLSVTGAGQSTCVPTVVVDAGTPPPNH